MGLDLAYQEGQTPLDDDEKEGLQIETIATREELDEFEQQNIEQAVEWTMKRSLKYSAILTVDFFRSCIKECTAMCGHRQMSLEKPIKKLELTSGR